MEDKQKKVSKPKVFLLIGVSTAILLVTPVIILLFIGYYLDMYFKTAPLLMLVLALVGTIGGIMNVLRLMRAYRKL